MKLCSCGHPWHDGPCNTAEENGICGCLVAVDPQKTPQGESVQAIETPLPEDDDVSQEDAPVTETVPDDGSAANG